MQEIKHDKRKVYYTMGEVAEMFDVNPSLLRYWEKEFDILKPHRNKKGNRLFTPQDVDNVKIIYHLLKEKKMKIEVARKYIKDHKKEVDRDAEIVERLMSIRAVLGQIKQDMLHGVPEYDGADDAGAGTEGDAVVVGMTAVNRQGKERETEETAQDSQPDAENVLTATGVMIEEENPGRPPFEEQMLFEVVVPDAEPPTQENMIDSFLSKNYDPESDEAPEYDPFAAFAEAGADAGERSGPVPETVPGGPKVIEQTLF